MTITEEVVKAGGVVMAKQTADGVGSVLRAAVRVSRVGITDRELLRRYAEANDQAAFAALVGRHTGLVLGVCRRALANEQDAEDACQATFLVLARKARRGRWQPSVANWLYTTARRVARNARVAAERRARRERRAAVREPVPTLDAITGRELLAVLDEELDHLPPHYREPLVLCYLEGLTRDEAARRLGVPAATVKAQLERGRKRLGDALMRRGCALGVGLLALAATSPAGASPPGLVRAVLAAASGSPPAAVAMLAKGVAVNGLLNKVVLALTALIGAAAIGTGVGWAPLTIAGQQPDKAAKTSPAPAAVTRSADDKDSLTYAGRVLGPDGKPVAQALVTCRAVARKADMRPIQVTTGRDGQFRVTLPRADLAETVTVVASAAGYGPDWMDLTQATPADREITLRLAPDDLPINGRLLNLEGHGLAGVVVEVRSMEKRADDGDLAPFIATKQQWAHGNYVSGVAMKELRAVALPVTTSVTTDPDGRFRLTGFGRERVVNLTIHGRTVEPVYVEVLTHAGPVTGMETGNGNDAAYGPTFERVIPPGKPIVGIVREKGSGKPLAGIMVTCGRCEARTDADGRYRIEGARKRSGYTVTADAVPYFEATKANVADTPGFEPVSVDFDLERGLALRGRVLDAVTGKPVKGTITYLAFADNSYLQKASGPGPGGYIRSDGSFAFTALPGPGVLAVLADEDNYIKVGPAADWKLVPGVNWVPGVAHAFVRIDAAENDPKSATFDIRLQPAATVQAEAVGPDGQPFRGFHVAGLTASARNTTSWMMLRDSPTFTVRGLEKGKPRMVVVLSGDKKLGKAQVIRAEDAGPVQVRVEPLGNLTGRVVDADGRARSGVQVQAVLSRAGDDGTRRPVQFHVTKWAASLEPQATTDAGGKFRLDGLMPGLMYMLVVSDTDGGEIVRRDNVSPPSAGRTEDLGDLRSKAR
jgi:RNA polymerase sigma factor (sigma-70 family)